jgi:hypothetical protein
MQLGASRTIIPYTSSDIYILFSTSYGRKRMADNTADAPADGYYDDENTNVEELDLSFLDDDSDESKSSTK